MVQKFLKNDNEQIVTEYVVDRISENVKGNTLENILNDIEEKQKSIAEEEIKRIKIKSNLQRIKTTDNKLRELLDRYSTGNLWNGYDKTLRVTSHCLKFVSKIINGIKSPVRKSQLKARCFSETYSITNVEHNPHEHVVTSEQKQSAEHLFIREAQEEKFSNEFDALENDFSIDQSSNIANLNPAINENGLLYMKSRLDHHLAYEDQFINPIILPKEVKITEKIVIKTHSEHAHNGPEVTTREVKLKYWLLGGGGGRREIRRCSEKRK